MKQVLSGLCLGTQTADNQKLRIKYVIRLEKGNMSRITAAEVSRRNAYWMPKTAMTAAYHLARCPTGLCRRMVERAAAEVSREERIREIVYRGLRQSLTYKDLSPEDQELLTLKEYNGLLRAGYWHIAKMMDFTGG